MTSPSFPEPPPSIPATPVNELDALVDKLSSRKHAWAEQSIAARLQYLERLRTGVLAVAERWVAAAGKAKGFTPDNQALGEEWLAGPMALVRNIRLLIEALGQGGQPRLPRVAQRPGGQWVATVFPGSLIEKLMMAGITADIWIEPGQQPTQGRIYRESSKHAGVALVLGAGNVASIGPMDALHKLFTENEVVVLKMNPVNEYLGPFIAEAFRPLADDGFFGVVYGGAEVGQHLTRHAKVDSIHITGSDRTHDAIIWGGTAAEQEANKKANTPVCQKPISSELGCVTPVFVVPGPWSQDDLKFQARHVASMVINNGSFNCNAAKVLITAKGWEHRQQFVDLVAAELGKVPARKAYYPGARQRFEGFLKNYPGARKLQHDAAEVVPWTILPDVPLQKGEYALTQEAFCGVLAECSIDAVDAPSFMAAALKASRECLWGTLSCSVLVHPETERAHAKACDELIDGLHYGGVAINLWPGVIYGLVSPAWGAFPGHTLDQIVSGRGTVHNPYLVDHPQKSVVRGPFRIAPLPAWFAGHRNLLQLGQRLTEFEAHPSYLKLPGVVMAALKG